MRRESFKECIEKEHLFETGDKDTAMAEELLNLAEHKETFWKSISSKSKEFPSLFIEGYYEIIKELVTAVLLLDGWKALNHECLFAYLKEKQEDLELDFDYLLELKDLRNSIDYRGVKVSDSIWQQNQLKMQLTINRLKEFVRERV
jgi:hypothetical protein